MCFSYDQWRSTLIIMNNRQFVIRNILRGVGWLAAFLTAYILIKRYVNLDFLAWLEPIFDREVLIFSIFLGSEIIVGIIPPEFFMLWALRYETLANYSLVILVLTTTSYLAGVIGFSVGWYLNQTVFYRYLRKRFLKRMETRLQTFGPYLVVIAALTPIPFSGVAMLVGSVRYSFKKYLLLSLSRFLRFFIYAWIFWEAHIIA